MLWFKPMAELDLPKLYLQLRDRPYFFGPFVGFYMCMKTWRPWEAYHFPCVCDGTRWALWSSKDSNQKGLWDRENSVAVSLESLNWLNEQGEGRERPLYAGSGMEPSRPCHTSCFIFIPIDERRTIPCHERNWSWEWVSLVSGRTKNHTKCFWLRTEFWY